MDTNQYNTCICMYVWILDSGSSNAADLKTGPRRAVPKDQDGKRLKDRPKSSDL